MRRRRWSARCLHWRSGCGSRSSGHVEYLNPDWRRARAQADETHAILALSPRATLSFIFARQQGTQTPAALLKLLQSSKLSAPFARPRLTATHCLPGRSDPGPGLTHRGSLVCVYYCRTYDKAVCGGGGGQ